MEKASKSKLLIVTIAKTLVSIKLQTLFTVFTELDRWDWLVVPAEWDQDGP
jgi:hypothetical protein